MTDNTDDQIPATRGNPPAPASRKYASLIRSIRRQWDFASSERFDNIDFIRTEVRYDLLCDQWKELNELHLDIMDKATEAEAKEYEEMYVQAEDKYIECLSLFRIRMDQTRPIPQPGLEGTSQDGTDPKRPITVQVKMQSQEIKNNWGKFDGDLTKWKGFCDRFTAAIHENKDVDPSFKYTYLKNSLVGKAADTFGQGTESNAATYGEAWDRLNKVYNQKYLICRAHIQTLLSMPMHKGAPASEHLSTLVNTTHEQIRQLRSHDIPIDQWDMLICAVLHERLPYETSRQWDLHRSSETPTATEMLEFLDKQVTALTGLGNAAPENLRITISNDRSRQQRNAGSSRLPSRSSTPSGTQTGQMYFPCEVCKTGKSHPLYECETFRLMNHNSKWDHVRRNQLCPNCFKRGHGKENCYSVKCNDGRCAADPAHNSLLCPNKIGGKPKPVTPVNQSAGWADGGAWSLPVSKSDGKKKNKKNTSKA